MHATDKMTALEWLLLTLTNGGFPGPPQDHAARIFYYSMIKLADAYGTIDHQEIQAPEMPDPAKDWASEWLLVAIHEMGMVVFKGGHPKAQTIWKEVMINLVYFTKHNWMFRKNKVLEFIKDVDQNPNFSVAEHHHAPLA